MLQERKSASDKYQAEQFRARRIAEGLYEVCRIGFLSRGSVFQIVASFKSDNFPSADLIETDLKSLFETDDRLGISSKPDKDQTGFSILQFNTLEVIQ